MSTADLVLASPLAYVAREYKLTCLRETPVNGEMVSTPIEAAHYWRQCVATDPRFDPEREIFVVLVLNARKRIKGHILVSTGTLDTLLVHAREVFAPAIVMRAAAIVLMHNHPSGDPSPSEADVKVTRDMMRAGQLLKIEVCDHVIMGHPSLRDHASLRESGYFYA